MTKTTKITAVAIALFAITGCSTPSYNSSGAGAVRTSGLKGGSNGPTRDRIKRHVYLGLGLGASNLDPDTSQNNNFDVDNRHNASQLINAGIDLSRQIAVEAQAVNLGSAGFSPAGDIEYREINASALYYIGGNRHRFKRRGLTGYGRVGAGFLDNVTNGVPFDQVNGFHLLLGLGAEYMTPMGLGLRAEVTSYDEDINLANLGLIYRFGRQQRRAPIQVVAAPKPTPVPAPYVAPVIEAAVVEVDACLELDGVADGVNFETDSSNLTSESRDILSRFASTLSNCEAVDITVSAHTDSIGDEGYNDGLSLRRADSVVNFFEETGISTTRLNSTAYGESQPIDSNDTREGRARNRRVEMMMQVNDY